MEREWAALKREWVHGCAMEKEATEPAQAVKKEAHVEAQAGQAEVQMDRDSNTSICAADEGVAAATTPSCASSYAGLAVDGQWSGRWAEALGETEEKLCADTGACTESQAGGAGAPRDRLNDRLDIVAMAAVIRALPEGRAFPAVQQQEVPPVAEVDKENFDPSRSSGDCRPAEGSSCRGTRAAAVRCP
jgi:hypothetical protein